ncbi:MAG: hypothetical protein PHQ23_07190 [Candidatus Wallbacteria bacterium]|nr:hypothetical protein [Candidatus Wallbacteria bacterium]
MKFSVVLLLAAALILTCGCGKPYSMLDDREQLKTTFGRYISLLGESQFEQAYGLLYFGHIPQGGNLQMFTQAQKVMDELCSDIEYQASVPVAHGNLAVMDLDTIFHYKNGTKLKNAGQVFFVKSGDEWKIAIGEYGVRMGLVKVYPEFGEKFRLIRDISYLWKDGAWVKIEPLEDKPAQQPAATLEIQAQ